VWGGGAGTLLYCQWLGSEVCNPILGMCVLRADRCVFTPCCLLRRQAVLKPPPSSQTHISLPPPHPPASLPCPPFPPKTYSIRIPHLPLPSQGLPPNPSVGRHLGRQIWREAGAWLWCCLVEPCYCPHTLGSTSRPACPPGCTCPYGDWRGGGHACHEQPPQQVRNE